MPGTPRVVLLMSPGAGYDRGLFRGIARYARHYGSWVFSAYWEQRGMPQAVLLELDVQSLSAETRAKSFQVDGS